MSLFEHYKSTAESIQAQHDAAVTRSGDTMLEDEMAVEEVELRKGAQHHVGALTVAIISIKPSDDDPAVRLGLRNLTTDEADQVVFKPGEPQHLLDHTLEVVTITRSPQPVVLLRVEPDVGAS